MEIPTLSIPLDQANQHNTERPPKHPNTLQLSTQNDRKPSKKGKFKKNAFPMEKPCKKTALEGYILNLKQNICPQCQKKRDKLAIRSTYLDYIIEESDEVKDIVFIACNKCWENVKSEHNQAIIQHKDLEIKLKNKDIKILRLKLDMYSDSEGDVNCSSDEESHSECDSDSEIDHDSSHDSNSECENAIKSIKKGKKEDAPTSAKNDANSQKVFTFKNLKVSTKR